MVTIIKNQILKHLSRFTKNLSPEQINVSALRGQGSLQSLQLDETVLTELLELPSWMRLSSATCGRATFHVHWTKLKNMPIELNLEDVQIIVETCSELRSPTDPSSPVRSPVVPPTKYTFINKVIDGITITVDTVRIQFTAPVFVATVQLSRISVESRTPQWQRGDLRLTRLKDPQTAQILIFKEISWQSARIEAHAVKEGGGLPPLRLLTNQAQCRITIKKRLSDCFVVGSRLVLILEEALWVLTDRQLGAALAFADSLASLERQASAQITRDKAKRKLETLPEYLAQVSQSQGQAATASNKNRSNDPLLRLFAHHDVTETSYHFLSSKIDLHLCDDPGLGRSSHPSLTNGAALQVTLQKIQFDYYPYHLAAADRNRWPGYRESAGPHSQWLRQALTAFRGSLFSFLDVKTHKPSVSDDIEYPSSDNAQPNTSQTSTANNTASSSGSSPARTLIFNQLAKLMTSCVILRLEDFTLYKISTGEKKEIPKPFISGDRERFTLPDEVRALHVEFVHFYYPGDIQFPVPSPKLYVQLNPVKVLFDLPSVLWCNSFVLNLVSCIKTTQVANIDGESDLAYVDVNVEAIMPRVIIESGKDHPGQRDRPKSLQVHVSRASITNSHGTAGGIGELATCLATYAGSSLLQNYCCSNTLLEHATDEDLGAFSMGKESQRTRVLWGNPRKVWCVRLEPLWADFCGARASPHRPTPLLDAVPFTLWVYMNMDDNKQNGLVKSIESDLQKLSLDEPNGTIVEIDEETAQALLEKELKVDGEADIQIVAQCSQLVSVQLNHYQYLFILRLAERLTELTAFLTLDAARVSGSTASAQNMIFGCIIPQVEITLVLPSCCPGKESSRDLDSVLPDSSSLLDLQQNTGSGTLCNQPHGNGSSHILSQSSIDRHIALNSSQPSITLHNLAEETVENEIPPVENNSVPLLQKNQSLDWTNINKIEQNELGGQAMKENPTKIFGDKDFSSFLQRGFTSLKNKMALEGGAKVGEQSFSHGTSPSPGHAPSIADQWDSVSVASSDSERYVMVKLAGDQEVDTNLRLWEDTSYLNTDGNIEIAAEVVERSSSPSERSLASSCRRRDLVSMSTFKLKHVELLQVSKGFYSRVRVDISDIGVEECSSIPWDELQSKFATRSRGWSEYNNNLGTNEDIRIKLNVTLDHYPLKHIHIPVETDEKVSLESVMNSFSGLLCAKVADLDLSLNMSTAMGLSDLIEDEILIPPKPLKISLNNISLLLNEDRPTTSISSPGAIPLQLQLGEINIHREKDGVLHIKPTVDVFKPTTPLSQSISEIDGNKVNQLMQENELLRRRLNALERLALENDSFRRSKEEIDILKSLLMTAQDQVVSLLDEKSTLIDTVRTLQERASGVEVRGVGSVWSRHNKR